MTAKISTLFAARFAPSVASVLVHVGAVTAFAGHVATATPATSADEGAPIEIALIAEQPAPLAPPEPAAALPTRSPVAHASLPTHRHAYPVAPEHEAHDHDPVLVHLPLGATPPATAATAATPDTVAPPPRFTMSFSGPTAASHADAHEHAVPHQGVHGAPAGSPRAEGQGAGDGAVLESSVSRPARLLASAPLAYPPEARAAEVEADVPLEIVVDATGSVLDARVVRPAGLGLDAAAVAAVRRYRFTPAERGGQPVRVRMRWSVEFRLR